MVIEPGNILYQRVEEPDVEEIFRETVLGGRVVERLLYEDPRTGLKARTPGEIPFYAVQQRIVLEHNGRIDPTRIEDYIAVGGYSALRQGPLLHGARAGHPRSGDFRPARPRRRRLPHGAQVEELPGGATASPST